MAYSFFQQFGREKLFVIIFPLWIVSAFGFFRVTIIPCAGSIISYLVSRVPSCHLIVGIKAWLSPPYIYIVLNLIILAIAAQNGHLLQISSRKTKTKQITEKISDEKDESSDFSTDKILAVNISHSPAAVDFPEARTDQDKLSEQKTDEDGEPVLDTLEEAWKMIMEAQGKKA